MIWPDGHISNLDNLAQLEQSGTDGVLSVDPTIVIMVHAAQVGQHDETVIFYDNMNGRNVQFDVMGMSYYPMWHVTLDDLRDILTRMTRRFDQDIILVEYSQAKREVHDIVFSLPDGIGKCSAIWEPLNTWESIFDKDGKSNDLILIYDEVSMKFMARR
jgi:beta-galactosidase